MLFKSHRISIVQLLMISIQFSNELGYKPLKNKYTKKENTKLNEKLFFEYGSYWFSYSMATQSYKKTFLTMILSAIP